MCSTHRPHAGQHMPVDFPSERKLVAGDTLFRDSIGRTDLPGRRGASYPVHSRQADAAARRTLVIPGHETTPTIGHEKQSINLFCKVDAGQAKAFFTFGPHWWGHALAALSQGRGAASF